MTKGREEWRRNDEEGGSSGGKAVRRSEVRNWERVSVLVRQLVVADWDESTADEEASAGRGVRV